MAVFNIKPGNPVIPNFIMAEYRLVPAWVDKAMPNDRSYISVVAIRVFVASVCNVFAHMTFVQLTSGAYAFFGREEGVQQTRLEGKGARRPSNRRDSLHFNNLHQNSRLT